MAKTADMRVEQIDCMGDDMAVVNAARVSFAKIKQGPPDDGDIKLIAYLAAHDHWSPFAHAFLKFRIKAPIFVARQLVKHQVGLAWNEVSRRYVSDEPEFYIPNEWRAAPVDGAKQGSSDGADLNQQAIADEFWLKTQSSYLAYDRLLGAGVAPEMARMVLPLNVMTEWIWSGSLFAFARVCKLRLDAHAQSETRMIAEDISAYIAEQFPFSWNSLMAK